MPDGKIHDRIGLLCAPLVFASTGAAWGADAALATTAAHVFSVIWLSPDLDLGSATIDRRWGGRLGEWLWAPYDVVFPHRGLFSHSGFSVFIRAFYVLLVASCLVGIAGLVTGVGFEAAFVATWRSVVEWVRHYPNVAGWIALGLFTGDAIHTLADKASKHDE